MKIKIGLSGTHGVGKTTAANDLAAALAGEFPALKILVLPEVARSCPWQINEHTSPEAQRWLYHRQMTAEIEAAGGYMQVAGTLIGIGNPGDPAFTLQANHHHAVSISLRGRDGGGAAEMGGAVATALRSSQGGGDKPHVMERSTVRRLMPTECEALQGFPRNYTLIPWRGKPAEECPDGHRYKALGNSMAVPVMRWIGERINRL